MKLEGGSIAFIETRRVHSLLSSSIQVRYASYFCEGGVKTRLTSYKDLPK